MKFFEICLRRKLVTSKLLRAWGLISTLFLGAKSTSILDCVGPSVGPSVRPPRCAITWKTRVTSRLLREEEEEEETDYVAIPLRRDSFAPRD
jgi:hypothetical protein